MKIISIEGIDQCGKETQVQMLWNSLTAKGYNVGLVSFPRYHTTFGQLIKAHLEGKVNFTNETFHLLYEADRFEFQKDITQMEGKGYDFLICDRYIMSNLAFGTAKGLDLSWLLAIQLYLKQPDLNIILDIPIEESFRRKSSRRDKHESDVGLLNTARVYYKLVADILNEAGFDVVIVNGNQSKEEVQHDILLAMKEKNFV